MNERALIGTETTIYVNGARHNVHVYKSPTISSPWIATGICDGLDITVAGDDALRAVLNWKQLAQSKASVGSIPFAQAKTYSGKLRP